MTEFMSFLDFLGIAISSPLFYILVVLYLVIFHLEKLEMLSSKVYSIFQFTGTAAKKKTIAKDIRSKILKVSKDVSKQVDGVLPYDLKIDWVKEVDRKTFVEGNQVVVRMNNRSTKTENLVYALNTYVEHGLIPKARKYIDRKVMKSSDLMVVRNLLQRCYMDGLDYFDDEHLEPLMSSDAEIGDYIEKIAHLDDAGLFFQVMLSEFIQVADKIFPKIPDPVLITESKEFLTFLYDIATKPAGQDVDLVMNKNYFKVAVVMMAKKETASKSAPYVKRAEEHISKGIETIYLIADSRAKAQLAHDVSNKLQCNVKRANEVTTHKYRRNVEGKTKTGVCIVIRVEPHRRNLRDVG